MKFSNFLEATKHAKGHRAVAERESSLESEERLATIDPALYKYFFELQVKIEKEAEVGKGMDYHLYAHRMWEKLVGDINEQNEPFFHQFENEMILGLHKINMEPLVYPHVVENLVTLIQQYADSIKHLALWSTGDVEMTGYQVGKINSSRIIRDFHTALKKGLPKGQAGEFMKEKTSYLVSDDKFKVIAEYAEEVLSKPGEEKMKIVIIEDSKNNFGKVKNALARTLGEEASRVEIVPIWVTYSREGENTRKAAESSGELSKFEEQKTNLNAIDTFSDLTDVGRFGPMLEGAYLFVDFDGVIGNNIEMRKKQAQVIYGSLLRAAQADSGLQEQEVVEEMKNRI